MRADSAWCRGGRSRTPAQLMLRPQGAIMTPRAGARHGQASGEARDRQRRSAQGHGERHPRAGHGRGGEGQVGPSGHADGHGRCGDRAVHALPQVRRLRARLARPRPLRALRRPRLDAALRAAASHRLCRDDDAGARELPPARLQDRGPSRVWARARHRDDHGPAGPGPRQCGRHGARRAAAQRAPGRWHRRSLHLRPCRRRLPHGRHQP